MDGLLKDFMKVWDEVSAFIAPEFRPTLVIRGDYQPYGQTDMTVTAAIFNEKYAVFEAFREWNKGADKVVRLETFKPDVSWKERCESRGFDPSIISESIEGRHYSPAFFLVESIMGDWQDKLRAEGKH